MFHKLTSNDTEQAELAKVEYLLFILVLFSGKTRSNSLCFNSDSRNPTKSCPFPTWIPEIRPHYYPFLSGFLKSNTIMCAVKVGFQKSEVAGSVSCSDSWNPGHCGALLSGISQMVGDDGFLVHIHFVFVNSSILLRSASISYGLNSPGSILPF